MGSVLVQAGHLHEPWVARELAALPLTPGLQDILLESCIQLFLHRKGSQSSCIHHLLSFIIIYWPLDVRRSCVASGRSRAMAQHLPGVHLCERFWKRCAPGSQVMKARSPSHVNSWQGYRALLSRRAINDVGRHSYGDAGVCAHRVGGRRWMAWIAWRRSPRTAIKSSYNGYVIAIILIYYILYKSRSPPGT